MDCVQQHQRNYSYQLAAARQQQQQQHAAAKFCLVCSQHRPYRICLWFSRFQVLPRWRNNSFSFLLFQSLQNPKLIFDFIFLFNIIFLVSLDICETNVISEWSTPTILQQMKQTSWPVAQFCVLLELSRIGNSGCRNDPFCLATTQTVW